MKSLTKVRVVIGVVVVLCLGVALAVSLANNAKLQEKVDNLTQEKISLAKELKVKEKTIEERKKLYTQLAAQLHKVKKELAELKK
jgi:septal ring factor EnvC (AmiA/AmiB activator)